MKKLLTIFLSFLLCMTITGCSSDNEDDSSGDTDLDSEDVAGGEDDDSQADNSEYDLPLTFYECYEITDNTADIASLIISDISAPYSMEEIDSVGAPFNTYYAYYDGDDAYLTYGNAVTPTLSELFDDEHFVKPGDTTSFFNDDTDACGLLRMIIDDTTPDSEPATMEEAYNNGDWSLLLGCSEIVDIDSCTAMLEFVDTYGSPTSVRLLGLSYTDDSIDENGVLIKDGDMYCPSYMVCYEYDEYTILFSVVEIAMDGREDSNISVSGIYYYPTKAWNDLKVYWEFTD